MVAVPVAAVEDVVVMTMMMIRTDKDIDVRMVSIGQPDIQY